METQKHDGHHVVKVQVGGTLKCHQPPLAGRPGKVERRLAASRGIEMRCCNPSHYVSGPPSERRILQHSEHEGLHEKADPTRLSEQRSLVDTLPKLLHV